MMQQTALLQPSRTAGVLHWLPSQQRQRRRRAADGIRIAAAQTEQQGEAGSAGGRREVLGRTALLAALAASSAVVGVQEAAALGFKKDLTPKRKQKVPESAYTDGPQGLKYYDTIVGTQGPVAEEGRRVVVHFEAKWKGVTFITSRQGMGVTGGTPLGFDVGAKPGAGGTLKGLDLGVRGMRVGGQRKLIVPPELAYGSKGVGEVPGGATLDFDVQLLSIKTDSIGARVKLVEG